jgi:hypothetical protein
MFKSQTDVPRLVLDIGFGDLFGAWNLDLPRRLKSRLVEHCVHRQRRTPKAFASEDCERRLTKL